MKWVLLPWKLTELLINITTKLKPAFINFFYRFAICHLVLDDENTVKIQKRSVSTPKCQFNPAGQSHIQRQQQFWLIDRRYNWSTARS